jgi:hypothetical protein
VSECKGIGTACGKAFRTVVVLCVGLPSCAPHGPRLSPTSIERVEVVDLTPRFLAFYDSATARHADPDLRWELWRRLYHFAAVPPTPFGDSLARQLLDSAWARYPAALPGIRKGASAIDMSPDAAFERVAALLKCGDTVRIRLTVFVGGFEGNAFASGLRDSKYSIALPVEAGNPARSMIHELVHAVHRGGCAQFRTEYGQSLAELVVTEGLAMRVVERALPGHDAEFYTVAAPGWLAEARRRRAAILNGIEAHLTDSGPAVVHRFTFGEGTTGLSREAYYAAWELVGAMMERLGMSLHDVAIVPPTEYPALIRRAIDAVTRGSWE